MKLTLSLLVVLIFINTNNLYPKWEEAHGLYKGGRPELYNYNGDLLIGSADIIRFKPKTQRWESIFNGVPTIGDYIGVVQIFSINDVLFVIIEETFLDPIQKPISLIYKTTDDGASWKAITVWQQPIKPRIFCACIQNKNIFLGTSDGIYFSNSLGENWEKLTDTNVINQSIKTLTIKGSKIYAGSYTGSIFVSSDSGKTWSILNTQFQAQNCWLYSITFIDSILYAFTYCGTFKSTEQGKEWTEVTIDSTSKISVNSIYKTDWSKPVLFAGTSNGVYISSDNGNTWINSSKGLEDEVYASKSFIPIDNFVAIDNFIFAASPYGLFYSKNFGKSWRARFLPRFHSTHDFTSSIISNGNFIFVSINNSIYRSSDNCLSWERVNENLPPHLLIYKLVFFANYILAATSNGVYYSASYGEEWFKAKNINTEVWDLYIFNNAIFAGGNNGLYRSIDSGKTWQEISIALPNNVPFRSGPLASIGENLIVVIQPFNSDTSFIYISSNNGIDWLLLETEKPLTWVITSLIGNNSKLFATNIDLNFDIICSTDLGKTWFLCKQGLPSKPILFSKLDKFNSLVFLILFGYSYEEKGVYFSFDNGENWINITDNLLSKIHSIGFDNEYIYVVSDSWLFRRTLSEIYALSVPEQNYFNPNLVSKIQVLTKESIINITFEIPTSSFATIKIFDILGNEVATLVSDDLLPGSYVIEFNENKLTPGIYLVHLQTNVHTESKIIVLLK